MDLELLAPYSSKKRGSSPKRSALLRKVFSHTVALLLNHQAGNPPLQLLKLLV